jgi:hypothetical protein
MKTQTTNTTRIYFVTMAAYWLVFGLITAFYPKLMDLFQTETGISAKTAFSDHVWQHDGFDILGLSVILFVLSREAVSRNILIATAVAALMATVAVFSSLTTTPYWNAMFIVAGLGCFVFVIWGFALAAKIMPRDERRSPQQILAD